MLHTVCKVCITVGSPQNINDISEKIIKYFRRIIFLLLSLLFSIKSLFILLVVYKYCTTCFFYKIIIYIIIIVVVIVVVYKYCTTHITSIKFSVSNCYLLNFLHLQALALRRFMCMCSLPIFAMRAQTLIMKSQWLELGR